MLRRLWVGAMKRVYLLRHAKSSWKDRALADRDRPLVGRGSRAASAIADHLQAERARPELVLCSPALRVDSCRAYRRASSSVAGSCVRAPRSRRATPLATAAPATASATDSATRRLNTLGTM
jgi:hypothetical protein